MKKFIPYGKHFIDNADIEGVKAALKSNSLTQGPKIILDLKKKYQNMLNQICCCGL